MITHVRAFAEFHTDSTHVYMNVREAFTMKAHYNVLNERNRESGVCVEFCFCEELRSYLWEGERDRERD